MPFELRLESSDFQTSPVFSDVQFFSITIQVDETLAVGADYANPAITQVTYQVTGNLVAGTPSGFPAFDLVRDITGAEFYAQGSSLSFRTSASATLSDGLQAAELEGAGTILTFNGREVDNGRFHPALLELDANGTGRIQNSNNVPSQNPLVEVNFGEEYITDLTFDTGNLTLVSPPPPAFGGGGGSSALSALVLIALATAALAKAELLARRADQ